MKQYNTEKHQQHQPEQEQVIIYRAFLLLFIQPTKTKPIAQWTEGTYTPPSAVVNCLNGTMYIDIINNSSQSEIIYINNVSYGLLAGNTNI